MPRRLEPDPSRSSTAGPHGARRRRAGCAGRRAAAWLAAFSLALGLAGCNTVSRRMTIRTDPPGALVIIDGEEVGFTPFSTDFTYYATREITLVRDGYETLTVLQPVPPPWYQILPVEFFADNFLPFRVTNRHEFHYVLEPQRIVPTEGLLQRADGLRSEMQFGR